MTPLAYLVAKQNTLPMRERCQYDAAQMYRFMSDVHCFEMTETVQIQKDLGKQVIADVAQMDCKRVSCGNLQFLPAAKTWIEMKEDGVRSGFLLMETSDKNHACVNLFAQTHNVASYFAAPKIMVIGLFNGILWNEGYLNPEYCKLEEQQLLVIAARLHACLALINTPRIIGRRQHMPHRGLEKKLVAQRKVIGSFPLHAWTEILLKVSPPQDASGEPSTEAHLTGQRALHFVRQFLRIRRGKLELVRPHWRGDAALGIRRSRYHVSA